MDKRALLLGLGMGMIIGALLMQLFIMGEQSSRQLEEMDNTINSNQPFFEQAPAVEEGEAAEDEAIDNETVEDETIEDSEQLDSQEKIEQPANVSPTPVSDAELHIPNMDGEYSTDEQFPKTLLLRVYSGATVSETAEVLEAHSIVENKDTFISYIKSKRKRIRAGYFLISEQSSNEEVLKTLTTTPLSEDEALRLEKQEQYNIIFSPQR